MNIRQRLLGSLAALALGALILPGALRAQQSTPTGELVRQGTVEHHPDTASGGTGGHPIDSKLRLPVIVHVIARPLCSGLHQAVAPAVGLMLQNNAIIAKSQPLFNDYVRYNISGKTSATARQLAQVKMEYLVGPLVKNTEAIDKLLANDAIFRSGNGYDSKELAKLKAGLLSALNTQKFALDLINGFVATKQMANMQHAGFEYIGAINGTRDLKTNPIATATPNPEFYNNNYAGLAPRQLDPTLVDMRNVPGLSLGYNPIRAVANAMRWTRREMTKRQDAVAPQIIEAAHICTGGPPQKAP